MATQIEDVKYDDFKYCYQVLDFLNKVEQNYKKREELKQGFDKKIIHKQHIEIFWIFLFILSILLTILVAYFILNVSIEILVLPIVAFGVCVIGTFLWWNKIEKKNILRRENEAFEIELHQINKISKKLVFNPPLTPSRIKEDYLSIDAVTQLLNYLEKEQANSLEEAIYLMELDMHNVKYLKKENSKDNLFQKEKRILLELKNK